MFAAKSFIYSARKLLLLAVILIVMISPFYYTASSQSPNLPDADSQIYYGNDYGTAGIAQVMLKFLNISNSSDRDSNIMNSVTTALNSVWESRIIFEGNQYPSWEKGPEKFSIYPGKKYGAAGILPIFLKMYQYTGDLLWLDRVEQGYKMLLDQSINNSKVMWPYSYSMPKEDIGVVITDTKFGSVGIIEFMLSLYKVTGSEQYLKDAENIILWLMEISIEREINGITYQIVPWFSYPGIISPIKTGLESGIAGLALVISDFAILIESQKYLDWSFQLADFLVAIQKPNGGWDSDYDFDFQFTGYDEGVAGIIFALNKINQLDGSGKYLKAIEKGIEFLFDHYFVDQLSRGFYESRDKEQIKLNLNSGTLGVIKALISVQHFLDVTQYNNLIETFRWLLLGGGFYVADGETELFFQNYYNADNAFVDFSYKNGLAGLLDELLSISNNNQFLLDLGIDINNIINASLNTFLKFQNIDGHWFRQRDISANWIQYNKNDELELTFESSSKTSDALVNNFMWSFWLSISLMSIVFKRKYRLNRNLS